MMKKNSVQKVMRALHRDIGFLMIGLTIVYAISGILLVYRGTNFMKFDRHVKTTIDVNLNAEELGKALHFRRFKTEKKGDSILFDRGIYVRSTGEVDYTYKTLPEILNKFNGFHKSSSRSAFHVISVIYGILLFFLAISSFFMFKGGTKKFYRGIVISVIGVLGALLILFLM